MLSGQSNAFMIRVDASAQIGAGHLMRMLALGQLLSEVGHDVHFVTILYNRSIIDYYFNNAEFKLHYLKTNCPWDSVEDVNGLLSIASQIHPSWIVIDGYNFDSDYECQIKKNGYKLLRIDDIPSNRHYYADIILNQNFCADATAYLTGPDTKILAGLNYVLLRREFRKIDQSNRIKQKDGTLNVLVSLGGGTEKADALNSVIAEGVSLLHDENIFTTILVGKLSEYGRHLDNEAKAKGWSVEVKEHSGDMATEILNADLAIVSGGSTMWELIYMKVPFLAVSLNELQREYLCLLSENSLCVDVGWHEDLTAQQISRILLSYIQNKNCRIKMLDKFECIMDRNNIGIELLENLT